MNRISAIIVDDHRVVCEGLAKVLEADGRFEILGLAGSLAEAEVYSRRFQPDAVLLDLKLPDSLGYSGIGVVKRLFPEAKVLALTGYGDMAQSAAKKHGADAFLTKELASEVVADTLCSLFPHMGEGEAESLPLTRREYEVARLVADGMSNEEVAAALSLSVNTVKTHLSAVMTKLGLRDRVALALHWHRKSEGS